MRVYGVLIIVVLLAAVTVLLLQGRDAARSVDNLSLITESLRESGVIGAAVDRNAAKQIIGELRLLLDNPTAIADNLAGLREVAAIAASWARAAPSPSTDLHMAVSIRAAADELRSYGQTPSTVSLERARRSLDAAEAALHGGSAGSTTTDAIRDQLQNLGRAHQEKYQQVDELGN